MEKISKILPSGPRMQFIELSKSQPARPGSPSMGRVSRDLNTKKLNEKFFDDTTSIVEDQVNFSKKLDTQSAKKLEITQYKDTVENRRSKIAEQIANKFFDFKSNHSNTEKLSLNSMVKDENKAPDSGTIQNEKSISLGSVDRSLDSEVALNA